MLLPAESSVSEQLLDAGEALFSSQKILHRIFGHMYGALNTVEKNN